MKNGFRQSMAWLHSWVGLLFGVLLYFIFLTGTTGYFKTEIDRWMQPERPLVSNSAQLSSHQLIELGMQRLRENEKTAGAQWWWLILPTERNGNFWIEWQNPPGENERRGSRHQEYLDLSSGEAAWVTPRETGGGEALYRLHWRLNYLPSTVAYWIVGICTLLMLVGLVSGVVAHRKIFTDFFTLRLRKGPRSWLDFHNVVSVIALPFHFLITYSGFVFFLLTFMGVIVSATYGPGQENRSQFVEQAYGKIEREKKSGEYGTLVSVAPLYSRAEQLLGKNSVTEVYISNPGDQRAKITFLTADQTPVEQAVSKEVVYSGTTGELVNEASELKTKSVAVRVEKTLTNLHEGVFAGWLLRWLYFLSGLLACTMIASGMILWIAKRKLRYEKQGSVPDVLQYVVERVTIGTIVGLPAAIAAYLAANRLIAVDFPSRSDWEMHALFITWGVMLLYPFLRSSLQGWVEELQIAAGLFLFLPVLNFLTTDRHLGITIFYGDWVLAGIDIAAIFIGLVCLVCAYAIASRNKVKEKKNYQLQEGSGATAEALPAHK